METWGLEQVHTYYTFSKCYWCPFDQLWWDSEISNTQNYWRKGAKIKPSKLQQIEKWKSKNHKKEDEAKVQEYEANVQHHREK